VWIIVVLASVWPSSSRTSRAGDVAEPAQFDAEHVAVAKEQRRRRLVARRRGRVSIVRKVIELRDDLAASQLARMAHGVEPDEAARPCAVRLRGPVVARPVADGAADLVEESGEFGGNGPGVACQRVATLRQLGVMLVDMRAPLLRRTQFA